MSNAVSKKKKKTTAQSIEVPIKWNVPDNIITRFANNMVVQILDNEFKILFFETSPEIMLNKLPKEVLSNCVASVIVSDNKLTEFIDLLQRQQALHKQGKPQDNKLIEP